MNKAAAQLADIFDKPKQKAVAGKLGIDPSYLSLLISGKRKPSRALAVLLQREFHIPIEDWDVSVKAKKASAA